MLHSFILRQSTEVTAAWEPLATLEPLKIGPAFSGNTSLLSVSWNTTVFLFSFTSCISVQDYYTALVRVTSAGDRRRC